MKLTFVGGEPLLHPALPALVTAAKAAGLTTCVVTNGSLLDEALLDTLCGSLDWLTLSVDTSSDELHARIGRGLTREVASGHCGHLARANALVQLAKERDIQLKLNTVVCRENVGDDMTEVALRWKPDRWKVFKVLPIEGQNDGVSHTGAMFGLTIAHALLRPCRPPVLCE